MEKLTMPSDAAVASRKAFIDRTAVKVVPDRVQAEYRAKVRAQIHEDNIKNLKTNWFCAKLVRGFKGLLG